MSGTAITDLRVAIVDGDIYTLKAINAYLAWDRRTRVVRKSLTVKDFWAWIAKCQEREYPQVVILDIDNISERRALNAAIQALKTKIPGLIVICMAHTDDLDMLYAAAEGGASAFLLKDDVRIHISWAVCYISRLRGDEFCYSAGVESARRMLYHGRLDAGQARKLPGARQYQGLTPRVRQTIELYAVEGMPANLVADELALTVSAVRDNIKRAYQILGLQEYDENFLDNMNQRERAFMRLTALDDPGG